MSDTEPHCILIHISDLHLRYPLTAAGRKLRSRLGTPTHAFHFLQAAAEAVRRIRLNHPDAFLVVSGDLTTLGDPTSFDLARQLIERSTVVWEEVQHDVGLEFEGRYFVVPGNHDRYDDAWWEFQYVRFEDEFQSVLPTVNFRPYGIVLRSNWDRYHRRMPQVQLVPSTDTNFVVLLIGLNSTGSKDGPVGNIVRQVAQGFVPADELQFVERVMEDLRRGRVMLSSGERINLSGKKVFPVAVLHHHPYVPPDVDTSFFNKLINADVVVQRCREAGLKMLLFGHQHVAFVDPVTLGSQTPSPSQIAFGASGSLSVHGEPSNSMNVYRITEDQIEYQIWEFRNGLFRPDLRVGDFGW